jgi:hypothetical protein
MIDPLPLNTGDHLLLFLPPILIFANQGGTIRGSINLPAQSLYPTIPTLYSLVKAANTRKVIWYCCKLNHPPFLFPKLFYQPDP